MSFHDDRLPEDIERGARGGPRFKTNIVVMASGHEKRNVEWSRSRGSWDISYGIRNGNDLTALVNFFYARQGSGYGFPFRDWIDYQLTDVEIGPGDGSTTEFQTIKRYTSGPVTFLRPVYKPVSGTLVVEVNAVTQTEGVDYTVDYTVGIITFTAAPGNGLPVTVTGEFDVPVRFDTDELEIEANVFDQTGLLSGSLPGIIIVELRIKGGLL